MERSITVMMKFLSCWLIRALGAVHTTVREVGESTTVFIVTEYWGPAEDQSRGQVDHTHYGDICIHYKMV